MFKDFEWNVKCEITGENEDKNTVLTTLTTTLQTIAANPAILDNPTAKMLFNKILITSGVVSPIEIMNEPAQPIQSTMPNNGGKVGVEQMAAMAK